MSGRSQKPRNLTESKIRIIGGQWRGRKLSVGHENGLRPTGDRLRETLFNWLMADIHGAAVLDLFAGTGALGLEALSRGASSVTFLETNKSTATRLRENLTLLDSKPSYVNEMDSLKWLEQNNATEAQPLCKIRYDIVFMDPPFELNLWNKCVENLLKADILQENALIYIENPKIVTVQIPNELSCLKSKNAGATQASLYQRRYDSE